MVATNLCLAYLVVVFILGPSSPHSAELPQINNPLPIVADSSTIYKLPKSSPTVLRERYFKLYDGKYCHFANSDPSRSLIYKTCVCRPSYFGMDCGLPRLIWGQLLHNGTLPMTLKRVSEPRRLIEFKYHPIPESNTTLVNSTVCNNSSMANMTTNTSSIYTDTKPDLIVYSGPSSGNFTCMQPFRTSSFSCPSILCCWNSFWMRASELSLSDLVVIDIGDPLLGASLPRDVMDFLKFYHGYPEVLMIRRGPSVTVVASFNAVAVECNFDIRCIVSCESSKFKVISLDL